MSNPRYVPREFAADPREFGQRPTIEWRNDEAWGSTERARLDASRIQHGIAYGVIHLYMPRSPTKRMTTLAIALEVPYSRVQKLLTGHSVMQLEDLGRFRQLIGDSLDPWLLRERHLGRLKQAQEIVEREAWRVREVEKLRAASPTAGRRSQPKTPPRLR